MLIPAIILRFGVDVKLAGSLPLAVSLPTMLVGFSRYSRDRSFSIIGAQAKLIAVMAAGSVLGVFVGGQSLGWVRTAIFLPLLAIILLTSAVKVWQHA